MKDIGPTICLLIGLPLCAFSQQGNFPAVREIVVRNAGPGRVDEGFVRSRISLQEGSELSRYATTRDIKALLETGVFSDVRVEAEPVEDGVRAIYLVTNRLRLQYEVEIRGCRRFDESEARENLGIAAGDLVDDSVLGAAARKLKDEYDKIYYPDAKISWSIETTDRDRGQCRVVVDVNEGKRAPVRKVLFDGNVNAGKGMLRKAMKQPSSWNPLGFLFKKRRYEAEELDEGRRKILAWYLARGFLDVEVDPPALLRQKDGLAVKVTIREGMRYRVGEISFEGCSVFPEGVLRRLIPVRAGDVAALDAINAGAQAVKEHYGQNGYAGTGVRPLFASDKTRGVVDVRFFVVEGPLTRIRNVIIRGNVRTRDKVIRREVSVDPGDLWNESRIKRSERVISNLGFFSSVRSYPLDTVVEDEKDIVFDVEEQETGRLMMGAGFSSIDRVTGFIEVTQGNFDITGWPYLTGGGQKVRLNASFGTKRKRYELDFTEPWFLDRPLALGFDVDRIEVDQDDYQVDRSGAGVSLTTRLGKASRLRVSYRLESESITDVADTNMYFLADSPDEPYFLAQDVDTTRSTVGISLTHDTRNHPFVPSSGTLASLSGNVSGGPLGCDSDVYGFSANVAQFLPLWYGHVLSLHGKYEVVEEYGDTVEMPIDDRLFIGGGRTVRGFKYRDVGPKAFRDAPLSDGSVKTLHRPIGGRSLALANAEYTVPLIGPFRLAAFYDVGNVWSEAYEFDAGNLAHSAGAGLRIDIPYFPFRLDWAWALQKDNELTEEERFAFWIGYSFY